MPHTVAPANDVVERLVTMFRDRLESAVANGQRVRMTARDGTSSSGTVPLAMAQYGSLADILNMCEPDGSFELHVYIEPIRRSLGRGGK